MAVVPRQEASKVWINPSNGQVTKFGTAEAVPTQVGEYSVLGDLHVIEADIVLASLPTVVSTNVMILSDGVTVPAGAFIEKIETVVLKETSGTNANLNVGLVDQDRSTEIDFQAFLKAWDSGNDGTDLGERTTIVKGGTTAGDLVGTKITNAGLITANADTADFTAGVVKVLIYYSVPLPDNT